MSNKNRRASLTRRRFIELTGSTAAGLVIGIPLLRADSSGETAPEPIPYALDAAFEPNAFLQITEDNQVHFYLGYAEMGQGVYTGLTTLIAEELDVKPSAIQVHLAGAHPAYAHPLFKLQLTGGSTTMAGTFVQLRQAAADTRATLMLAAANQLDADPSQLEMRSGQVIWGQKTFPYGEFAATAAGLQVAENTALKSPADFKYIGTDFPKLDGVAKATGTAGFGIDVDFPGLKRAVIKRCPVNGGSVKSFDGQAATEMPGVVQVVQIFNGVAVVAESYWQAKQAAEKLVIEWEMPDWQSAAPGPLRQDYSQSMNGNEGQSVAEKGEGAQAMDNAVHIVESEYWAPYLAHATMEPMNCTVHIHEGQFEIWAPSQAQGLIKQIASHYSGIDASNIQVHATFLGGGFGRRAYLDFVAEAAQIAVKTLYPIQLVWSREDDTRHDYYRPASLVKIQAGLDAQGRIVGWNVKRAGPSLMAHTAKDTDYGKVLNAFPPPAVDWSSYEGLVQDYDLPNSEIRLIDHDPGLRIGFWRSVGHSCNAFFKETLVDELAALANRDPLEFRLDHTQSNERLNHVIQTVAEQAGWGKILPDGHYHGIAAHESFRTFVAQVAEVSVIDGEINIHKITCAVDPGIAVNPDNVKAQMESAIVYGLSAALFGEIELDEGAVKQSNFDDYPVIRMSQCPAIDVVIIPSDLPPSGVGEPGLPPLAPAIGNAVFRATGQRSRSLPFKLKT